jgi:hypothetical protein
MLCLAYNDKGTDDEMTIMKCKTTLKEMNVSWVELFYFLDSVFIQVVLPLWQ